MGGAALGIMIMTRRTLMNGYGIGFDGTLAGLGYDLVGRRYPDVMFNGKKS